jgi:citrate synthase
MIRFSNWRWSLKNWPSMTAISSKRSFIPNVDFYSGIILKAMGFPTSMFTVLFAVARTTGWIAQWNEMITDPTQRIGRPRQLYTGPTERPLQRSAIALGCHQILPHKSNWLGV